MKFLLDESAEFRLADLLRQLGHDVTAIAHDYPESLADDQVLSIARYEQRILITNDRDFGELVFRRRLSHHGVIFFRLGDQSLAVRQQWLVQVLEHHAEDLGQFLVVTERGIRVRRASEN